MKSPGETGNDSTHPTTFVFFSSLTIYNVQIYVITIFFNTFVLVRVQILIIFRRRYPLNFYCDFISISLGLMTIINNYC